MHLYENTVARTPAEHDQHHQRIHDMVVKSLQNKFICKIQTLLWSAVNIIFAHDQLVHEVCKELHFIYIAADMGLNQLFVDQLQV